ncbi:hemolytic protein HlpA-like protein [Candidatus Pacearchaeota archaeon]|nr:hemolytic protein HlpA-like protein [Candidatus Pacearchaeota archaeon]|tara:strand:+ start:158 stop:1066 length:909 start_codon:yes stop_codon:yes gene_type:complete
MKNKQNFKLNTPILYLVFNRVDTIKRTFPEIRKAKPKQLFIAADGPRTKEEKKKTDGVRRYILDNITWECEVKTLFRDKNLGCKYAVSSALDWFFENVPEGIILEDDCLPSQSFFRFCQEMLERYREDKRIMHISGTNVEGIRGKGSGYFFSKVFNVWGWASWRRAWKGYDVEILRWPQFRDGGWMRQFSRNYLDNLNNVRGMNNLYNGKLDTWDYQWAFYCLINAGLAIIPDSNLIKNLGFNNGTHMSKGDENKVLELKSIKFPLGEPDFMMESKSYLYSAARFFYKGRVRRKILNFFQLM